MKTAQDFKVQSSVKGISKWLIHDCSICGYPCGYYFENSQVFYDVGCDCTGRSDNFEPRDWENVAAHYNMQTHPDYIKEMNEFWGFHQTETAAP